MQPEKELAAADRPVAADGRPAGVARRRPCRGASASRRGARRRFTPAPRPLGRARASVWGQDRVEVGKAAVRPEARAERNTRGGPRDHDLPVPGHRREQASARCEASAFAQPVATLPTCLRAATSQTRTLPSAFASATGAVVAEGRAGRELAVHPAPSAPVPEAAEPGDAAICLPVAGRQTLAAPSWSTAATSLESGLKTAAGQGRDQPQAPAAPERRVLRSRRPSRQTGRPG